MRDPEPFDPNCERRKGLDYTTSLIGETTVACCTATLKGGDTCGRPILVPYELVRKVQTGAIRFCPYHQSIQDLMTGGLDA